MFYAENKRQRQSLGAQTHTHEIDDDAEYQPSTSAAARGKKPALRDSLNGHTIEDYFSPSGAAGTGASAGTSSRAAAAGASAHPTSSDRTGARAGGKRGRPSLIENVAAISQQQAWTSKRTGNGRPKHHPDADSEVYDVDDPDEEDMDRPSGVTMDAPAESRGSVTQVSGGPSPPKSKTGSASPTKYRSPSPKRSASPTKVATIQTKQRARGPLERPYVEIGDDDPIIQFTPTPPLPPQPQKQKQHQHQHQQQKQKQERRSQSPDKSKSRSVSKPFALDAPVERVPRGKMQNRLGEVPSETSASTSAAKNETTKTSPAAGKKKNGAIKSSGLQRTTPPKTSQISFCVARFGDTRWNQIPADRISAHTDGRKQGVEFFSATGSGSYSITFDQIIKLVVGLGSFGAG
jgi:hypothetical protein